jgi:hypothetical protein
MRHGNVVKPQPVDPVATVCGRRGPWRPSLRVRLVAPSRPSLDLGTSGPPISDPVDRAPFAPGTIRTAFAWQSREARPGRALPSIRARGPVRPSGPSAPGSRVRRVNPAAQAVLECRRHVAAFAWRAWVCPSSPSLAVVRPTSPSMPSFPDARQCRLVRGVQCRRALRSLGRLSRKARLTTPGHLAAPSLPRSPGSPFATKPCSAGDSSYCGPRSGALSRSASTTPSVLGSLRSPL